MDLDVVVRPDQVSLGVLVTAVPRDAIDGQRALSDELDDLLLAVAALDQKLRAVAERAATA
jgi:hypothetical protein